MLHMKKMLVILGTVGVAFGHPSWYLLQPVQDTPEVAAAKHAHLAALVRAQSSHPAWSVQERSGPEDDGSWKDDESWKHYDNGSWKDDTRSSAQYWSGPSDRYGKKWTGPVALPPGYDKNGAPLQVLDTPEVSAEKSKHFHLYSYAAAKAAPPVKHY